MIPKRMKRCFFASLIAAVVLGMPMPTAWAESTATLELHVSVKKPDPVLGIQISPAYVEIKDLPLGGGQSTDIIRLANTGNVPERVLVTVPLVQKAVWKLGPDQDVDTYWMYANLKQGDKVAQIKVDTCEVPYYVGTLERGFIPENPSNEFWLQFNAPTAVTSASEIMLKVIFTVEAA